MVNNLGIIVILLISIICKTSEKEKLFAQLDTINPNCNIFLENEKPEISFSNFPEEVVNV